VKNCTVTFYPKLAGNLMKNMFSKVIFSLTGLIAKMEK
jgi:hypothetical protein